MAVLLKRRWLVVANRLVYVYCLTYCRNSADFFLIWSSSLSLCFLNFDISWQEIKRFFFALTFIEETESLWKQKFPKNFSALDFRFLMSSIGTLRAIVQHSLRKNALSKSFNQCTCVADLKLLKPAVTCIRCHFEKPQTRSLSDLVVFTF